MLFPTGRFANDVRQHLASLNPTPAPPPIPAPAPIAPQPDSVTARIVKAPVDPAAFPKIQRVIVGPAGMVCARVSSANEVRWEGGASYDVSCDGGAHVYRLTEYQDGQWEIGGIPYTDDCDWVHENADKYEILTSGVHVVGCVRALADRPDDEKLAHLMHVAAEQREARAALRSTDPGPAEAYLTRYPTGRFANDVKQYLHQYSASLSPPPTLPSGSTPAPSQAHATPAVVIPSSKPKDLETMPGGPAVFEKVRTIILGLKKPCATVGMADKVRWEGSWTWRVTCDNGAHAYRLTEYEGGQWQIGNWSTASLMGQSEAGSSSSSGLSLPPIFTKIKHIITQRFNQPCDIITSVSQAMSEEETNYEISCDHGENNYKIIEGSSEYRLVEGDQQMTQKK